MLVHSLGIALLSVAAVGSVPAHEPGTSIRQPLRSKPVALYSAHQMEAYLSAEDIAYIRPGYKIKSFALTNVAPGKKPMVEVYYVDDMDQPLDYLGKATPGPLSMSFILAWYDGTARQYTSYTTRVTGGIRIPSADQGGRWTHLEMGHSKYEFGTTLPADLKMDKTTTLSIYGRRDVRQWLDKYYYLDNTNYDFRPDGGTVLETWAAMDTAACNQCHDPIAFHGGTRRTVKNCVLCHQPQIPLIDGENFDMKVFIHEVHKNTTYPQDIRNCTTCHQKTAAEGHIWYTNPSRKACGSCHDGINWETGEGHVAGPMSDDEVCQFCHPPQGEFEFDPSVKGAHTIPTKSAQLKGLKIEILNVTNTGPGQKPTITFKVTNGDGSFVDPKTLNSLRFNMGGSNLDYTRYIRESANNANSVCNAGVCTYTYTAAIPADATGSWTMTADCYRNVMLNPGPTTAVREAAKNPLFTFPVTDAQGVARRSVADTVKCNKCHETLALHGGQRYLVEECVICHNPTATATVADGGANESISMQWMTHKIHTGEELDRDYMIDDISYLEVLYPGDRRNCEACHKAGTYDLPLPAGLIPTSTPRDFVPQWQPSAAACLSCHDTVDAAAHAYVNIAPFAEACAACHGEGADFAVSKVHAR